MAKQTENGSHLIAARITAEGYAVWRKLPGKNDGDKLRKLLAWLNSDYSVNHPPWPCEFPDALKGKHPER